MAQGVWYCSYCNTVVEPQDVTYLETHDVRAGGCGQPVVSLPLPKRSTQATEATDYWIGLGGEALDSLYASLEEAFTTWLSAAPSGRAKALGDYYRAAERVQAALRKARGEEVS